MFLPSINLYLTAEIKGQEQRSLLVAQYLSFSCMPCISCMENIVINLTPNPSPKERGKRRI